MNVPDHTNRSPDEILSVRIFHDAQGFGYRAASWLDYAKRSNNFAALHYACIDGRLSIEHLLFEQIAMTAQNGLSEVEYQKCLKEPSKLRKHLSVFVPDHAKLVQFSQVVSELSPGVPAVNVWEINPLMKLWGRLSALLHWSGAAVRTTEEPKWQATAKTEASAVIEPYWEKMCSAQSGSLRVDSMPPAVREVWESFRSGQIDRESAKIRLELVRP